MKEHVKHMGKKRNVFRVTWGNPLGISRRRLKHNVYIDFKEI
jgi:hypothetical protein